MQNPNPVELLLQQVSRQLKISFDDGQSFVLPYEYLRVFSPSAEVQGHSAGERIWPTGKADIGISAVSPVGNYAVLLEFSDGHKTGIFSWGYLRELGLLQAENWAQYLAKVGDARVA
jgi:DUF971 family protein